MIRSPRILVLTATLAASAPASATQTSLGTDELKLDQRVIGEFHFDAAAVNDGFTTDRAAGVELALRARPRFPDANGFHSNGDGTYTINVGAGGTAPLWDFEWSINTDYTGASGLGIADLTYEFGIDHDSGPGTKYRRFDPLGIFASGMAITGNNLVHNVWPVDLFDSVPFDVFDPLVPGRYDVYLAAFRNRTEVARTTINLGLVGNNSLTLEGLLCQTDQDLVKAGIQIEVELWMRNLQQDVTGYQAFLAYDTADLTYEGACSSYTSTPFDTHIQAIATADVALGQLRLDGNAGLLPPITGTDQDALLATLVFTVAECDPVSVAFDLTQGFLSELSKDGTAIVTALADSPSILADITPPVLDPCPANITQSADTGSTGGCAGAFVTFSAPGVTDACDPSPSVVCSPASGSFFAAGITTVTCTATDACGNESMCTFDVEVTATNKVDVMVTLPGSVPTTRCITFQANSCSAAMDVVMTFTGSPATAIATIEIPCGEYMFLCAKDEQHTLWDTQMLTSDGTKYTAAATFTLEGGDTDNDGDVDINDVTYLLLQLQLGGTPNAGTCPWDLTRDADFSNNGAVFSEDYTFLSSNWLSLTSCACTLTYGGSDGLVQRIPVRAEIAAADLTQDGFIDWRDVAVAEARFGLSGELSARMRASAK